MEPIVLLIWHYSAGGGQKTLLPGTQNRGGDVPAVPYDVQDQP